MCALCKAVGRGWNEERKPSIWSGRRGGVGRGETIFSGSSPDNSLRLTRLGLLDDGQPVSHRCLLLFCTSVMSLSNCIKPVQWAHPSSLSFLSYLSPLPLRPLPLSISTFGLKDTEDKPLEKTALSFFLFLPPSFLFRYRYYTLLRHFSAESLKRGSATAYHHTFASTTNFFQPFRNGQVPRAKFIRTFCSKEISIRLNLHPSVKFFNDHPASRYINFHVVQRFKTLVTEQPRFSWPNSWPKEQVEQRIIHYISASSAP